MKVINTLILLTIIATIANANHEKNKAQGPVDNLTEQEKQTKLGGDAKIRVDCPKNSKNECEPPISISFETPNSKKTSFCQENEGPEFGDTYESDSDDYTYEDPEEVSAYETTMETVYYTWRLKSDTTNAVSSVDPANDANIYGVMPCETIDLPATETMVVKYRHCVYDDNVGREKCAALKSHVIKIAAYDPDAISDSARPKSTDGMVYFRSGVKFKGPSGDNLFPAFKFNTTGFQNALANALNSARTKCKPGETECKNEFDEIKNKNIRILKVDDTAQKKDVLFEVRVPTKDGIPIQDRLLHPYFKYPLAIKLVQDKLIPEYNYEPSIEVDSSKAKLLEPIPDAKTEKITMIEKMAAGIIVLIVVGVVVVVVGLGVVAKKANENKAISQQLDSKSAQLDVKSAQLDAEGKKIAARYNELVQREKELNDKVATLNAENAKMEAEKTRLENEEKRIKAEESAAQAALLQAQESGDANAVEKAKVDMSAIAAKLSSIGKKKLDCSAEVDRITAEQERVKKELDSEVTKQKAEQHRKLQERLAKRKKKSNQNSAQVKPI